MTFYDTIHSLDFDALRRRLEACTAADVERALDRDRLADDEILPLFSSAADPFLERIAQRSAAITERRFGKVMQLYTPLYLSNECVNRCAYCGFAHDLEVRRITLTPRAGPGRSRNTLRRRIPPHPAGQRRIAPPRPDGYPGRNRRRDPRQIRFHRHRDFPPSRAKNIRAPGRLRRGRPRPLPGNLRPGTLQNPTIRQDRNGIIKTASMPSSAAARPACVRSASARCSAWPSGVWRLSWSRCTAATWPAGSGAAGSGSASRASARLQGTTARRSPFPTASWSRCFARCA